MSLLPSRAYDWPLRIACHNKSFDVERWLEGRDVSWQRRDQTPFRQCGYCGSIHPEDLFNYLHDPGVRLQGADWKLGWPHKFYVEGVPNPRAGQPAVTGRDSKTGDIWGTEGKTLWCKWYNEHLLDLEPPAFGALARLLRLKSGIEFQVTEEGGLRFLAPYRGYQK